MGDVNDFDIEKLIDTLLDNLDPNIPITILITGGPPCPDFSGIRANPSSASGTTGHLFQTFVEIIQQIKQVLQQIPIYVLIENVVPHANVQQDIQQLSSQLGIDPIIVDAEDGGIIHRKRLCWLSVEWDRVKPQLVANTPWDIYWTQTDTPWPRLHNPIAKSLQPPLDTKHFTAPAILQKGGLFHCLTTPALDEHGRPAPLHCNEKPDTIQRWQADHQRFAPWQYQHKYLVSDADGHKHLAPAKMREQMMGFDGQHTANMTPDKTEYHRNKALGNTWHIPSAIWLLLLMVMDTLHTPTTAIPVSPIQRATSVWLATRATFGPPPKPTQNLYMPQFCWREHLQWTQSLDTSHTPKPLDPTLEWVIQHSHLFHPVADFREQVVLEIRNLVEDMQETTEEWLRDLPQHVRKAYTTRKEATQVPVFTSLLQQINYPQADILHQELSSGFRLMERLQPGTNWYIRSGSKYLMPKSPEEFAEHNDTYVQQKLQQARVDDHYELMLEGIVQEVAMGRMNGPFTAPPHWEHQTITPNKYPELQLLPIPHTTPAMALAFSTQQTGSDGKEKIRRGEDWRRSGHNATCIMHDQPYHHTPDHFAALATRSHQHNPNQLLHVWGHDHDGAYRQLPLDRPEQAYVLLHTPDGPTLWSHNVLLFGSSASVWGYNRFGDAMVAVSRLILLCPTMHYVDDYGSTEGSHQADSGFRSFEDFNGALGYNMKTSKRQPPAPSHKIQGVIISKDNNHITLTPCPQRVERMCSHIIACLEQDTLEPDQARRMAGKCNFLTGRLFGKVGRAPLKAIYARAHSNISHLDKPTKSALYALLDIIQHCKPMRIPLQIQHRHFTIIYTDAYYTSQGTPNYDREAKFRLGGNQPTTRQSKMDGAL